MGNGARRMAEEGNVNKEEACKALRNIKMCKAPSVDGIYYVEKY